MSAAARARISASQKAKKQGGFPRWKTLAGSVIGYSIGYSMDGGSTCWSCSVSCSRFTGNNKDSNPDLYRPVREHVVNGFDSDIILVENFR